MCIRKRLQVLKTVDENARFMKVLFRLHGELLMGNRGSAVVELAASWAIIMIVTGLYLWWPRKAKTLGGIVYPRLRRRLAHVLARYPRRHRLLDFRAGPFPAVQRPALGEVLGRLLQERATAHRHGRGAAGLDERASLDRPNPNRQARPVSTASIARDLAGAGAGAAGRLPAT